MSRVITSFLARSVSGPFATSGSSAPNDHKDPEYDWGIFDRLSSIDDRVGPLVTSVARNVDRFGPYRERLRTARRKVDEGGHEWLTSPRIDSYHTVWMQLHEDLLLALGKERASEQ
jgi:hypothetical protein